MANNEIKEIVRETLSEIREQSLIERAKKSVLTIFSGAAGALITLLLIAQWSEMEQDSETARAKVTELAEVQTKRAKSVDAQFNVIIDRLAKLELAKGSIPTANPVPYADPGTATDPSVDSLESFEVEREGIQQQIDKEVYRLKKR